MSSVVARKIVVDAEDLNALFGANDVNLRSMEEVLDVRASARGNEVQVEGAEDRISRVALLLQQLAELQRDDLKLTSDEVRTACKLILADPDLKLRSLFIDSSVRVSPHRVIVPKSFHQKLYVENIRRHDLVFGIGPAGTGKTYLAMAMAVNALNERKQKRLILARPAVEAGEKLGFLPGDLAEKVHPYLRPLYDALHDMMDGEAVARHVARGTIEVAPIGFMRGRTLSDSFVILDEAQNTTSEQMKMFLTRIGYNSKVVVNGDVTQVDLPVGKMSGLREITDVIHDIPGIGFTYFDRKDVVRHPLVEKIVHAYETYGQRREANREATRPGQHADREQPEAVKQ